MWRRSHFVLAAAVGLVAMSGAVTVDPGLPHCKPASGVSGSIKSVGSDTMNNLMALWAEGFRKMYPNVQVEIEGKGSGTAPPALINGAATFGPMSRQMKSAEIDDFEERFGYKPTSVRTAIDMLAVFVHKDNPIAQRGLTLEELDGIFSKSRKSGHADVITWGQLGLTGDWANKPISLYGRNSASGTYGYFKKHALFKGDYKDSVKEQPGSSAVVQGVGRDKYGIGYSGIGYKTEDVAVVPIAPAGTRDFVPADPNTVSDYPLARFLYLYVNYKPGHRLEPLRAEFLKYIFSQEGQSAVVKDGFLPVTVPLARMDLEKVGLRLEG
ncbi:MAG: PstS family phosphate ABC transporter substrate-binding protein [Planctomycetota bacterium]|nr:PstS family phosphate ABC transporter substrate-binding protein [Planctomycetota bacterium]